MANGIASWAVELSLLRAQVGKEFGIVGRLKRTTLARDAIFFGAYGYFDLAAVRCLSDLSAPSLLPLDPDIVEAAPFRFFADSANEPRSSFLRSLRKWNAAIGIFFKIAPSIFSRAPNEVRWKTVDLLRKEFRGAHVFFGLGFSEVFVLTGGDDLPALLDRVTNFRYAPQKDKILGQHLEAAKTDYFFVKTATFPFVSYENVHRRRKYHLLKGDIFPVVTLSCDPASEGNIIGLLPGETEVRNSYGDTDLIVYWKRQKIPVSQFAETLSRMRELAGPIGSVQKTTSYLETPSRLAVGKAWDQRVRDGAAIAVGRLDKGATAAFSLIKDLQPQSLRASVTDLWLRLISCLLNPHVESGYGDMANTFNFIISIVREIAARKTSPIRRRDARFELSRLCDLARIAINQRYAGLETHPETLAHSQSPVLSDIRSMIAAASCLPRFILSNIFPRLSAERVWPGYVLFGTTYSHQWYPQDILALPAVAIYDPIAEWWKITHETAHAVFRLLELEKRIPRRLYRLVMSMFGDRTVSATHTLQEVFANWFDWRYMFGRDTPFFLGLVWKSWLEMPVVWRKKRQYLTRAFTIFLAEDFEGFQSASEAGNDRLRREYIPRQWERFIGCVRKACPAFVAYESEIQEPEALDAGKEAAWLIPAVYFYHSRLETVCRIEGLENRLNPPYAKLVDHLDALENGIVITELIPNPCRLQVELLRRRGERPSSLKTQGAFIYSLENSYVLATA